MTTVGPHRHDLELRLGGRLLREAGSTGQQRTAAIALKLCELATLGASAGSGPALLLDDVFAELDDERQRRLARRLLAPEAGSAPAQTFLTSPRESEVPEGFSLERFSLDGGTIRRPGRRETRVA
jgi:DNA replication and repair protein RecF